MADGDITKQTASLALHETPSEELVSNEVTISEEHEDTTTETVSSLWTADDVIGRGELGVCACVCGVGVGGGGGRGASTFQPGTGQQWGHHLGGTRGHHTINRDGQFFVNS